MDKSDNVSVSPADLAEQIGGLSINPMATTIPSGGPFGSKFGVFYAMPNEMAQEVFSRRQRTTVRIIIICFLNLP